VDHRGRVGGESRGGSKSDLQADGLVGYEKFEAISTARQLSLLFWSCRSSCLVMEGECGKDIGARPVRDADGLKSSLRTQKL
jgi:hypothetical protein